PGSWSRLPPHPLRHLDDARELRLLLGVPERIALSRAAEAALRAQRELLDRRDLRRLVDAPGELIRRFHARALARDQAEDHALRFGQKTERLGSARAPRGGVEEGGAD